MVGEIHWRENRYRKEHSKWRLLIESQKENTVQGKKSPGR